MFNDIVNIHVFKPNKHISNEVKTCYGKQWRPAGTILHIYILALEITRENDVLPWNGYQQVNCYTYCIHMHNWWKKTITSQSQLIVEMILSLCIGNVQIKNVPCSIQPGSPVLFNKYKCQNNVAPMHKWHPKILQFQSCKNSNNRAMLAEFIFLVKRKLLSSIM